MRKIIRASLLIVSLFFILPAPLSAGWLSWSHDPLLTIDDQAYTADDFRNWWENWREKDMALPKTVDAYVDWVLLYRQAKEMDLDNDPGYRRKVMTFLKARTLMLLKADAVDSKIKISEDDLWRIYKKSYVPLWQVNTIIFHGEPEAESAYKKLVAGDITVQQLHDLKVNEGGPISIKSRWQRPRNTHEGWREILRGLGKGGFARPQKMQNGVMVLQLLSVKGADKEDFEKVREGIRQKVWKEKEGEYTNQLIEQLIKKYHVTIDTERLKNLNIHDPDSAFSDDKLIIWDKGSVTEKQFVRQVRTQQQFRAKNKFNDEGFLYKEQVLGGIISQTLTTQEGLERHYEKKPPFDKIFLFYTRHRLIKSLEQKVLLPENTVSKEAIQAYYDQNLSQFSRPGLYKLAIAEGGEENMKAMWTEVVTGGDLKILVQKNNPHASPSLNVHGDEIDPVLKKVVSGLAQGDVSSVFAWKGQFALVQLISFTPPSTLPLDRVENFIDRKIRKDKMKDVRNGYVKKLRNGATIKVNDKVWQHLRRELQNENEKNQN